MRNFGKQSSYIPRSLSSDFEECTQSNNQMPPDCKRCLPCSANSLCLRAWNFDAVMDCMFCKLGPDLQGFARDFCKNTEMGNCDSNAEKRTNMWIDKFDTIVSKESETSVDVTYQTTVNGK